MKRNQQMGKARHDSLHHSEKSRHLAGGQSGGVHRRGHTTRHSSGRAGHNNISCSDSGFYRSPGNSFIPLSLFSDLIDAKASVVA